jgi:hypothetical protein
MLNNLSLRISPLDVLEGDDSAKNWANRISATIRVSTISFHYPSNNIKQQKHNTTAANHFLKKIC